jgi:hypothetical protein
MVRAIFGWPCPAELFGLATWKTWALARGGCIRQSGVEIPPCCTSVLFHDVVSVTVLFSDELIERLIVFWELEGTREKAVAAYLKETGLCVRHSWGAS